MKINSDGSSRGNPDPTSISGIGKDSLGLVIFIFLIYHGTQTINLVERLAILATLEKAHALGWRKIVCEFDSQVLINLLNEQKVDDVNWQLARIVQQILPISSLMKMVTFAHIPREWNRATNCLEKWAPSILMDGELRNGSWFLKNTVWT